MLLLTLLSADSANIITTALVAATATGLTGGDGCIEPRGIAASHRSH